MLGYSGAHGSTLTAQAGQGSRNHTAAGPHGSKVRAGAALVCRPQHQHIPAPPLRLSGAPGEAEPAPGAPARLQRGNCCACVCWGLGPSPLGSLPHHAGKTGATNLHFCFPDLNHVEKDLPSHGPDRDFLETDEASAPPTPVPNPARKLEAPREGVCSLGAVTDTLTDIGFSLVI